MAINLKKVFPVYLEEEKIHNSQVWERDIEFSEGTYVQVTAPSGSGKSSFVHFLYNLRNDYEGEISIDGINIKSAAAEEISSIRQRKLSIVFQDMRLFPNHTLYQNILVKHTLMPFQPEAEIRQMAKFLGIETKLNQPASKCSYGEQQRAAIIRALQQPFDYLLLDEPFSHLDDANSEKGMQLILAEAEKRDAAIIMADLHPNKNFPAEVNIRL